ncbi:MAG: helix-turn-helix transcriptional regulator [Clostridia bacterium]|nr:helix-turn-helix transcriptional regulator [Clostridia bacterium]
MTIKDYRKEKKFTMKQVAVLSGITEGAYCMIENGNRRPSVDVAQRIALVLNIPEDKILSVFYKQKTPAAKDG